MRHALPILAVAGLLVLAGCASVGPVDDPDTTTDTTTDRPSTTVTTEDPAPSTTGTTTTTSGSLGDDGYYNAFTFEATTVTRERIAREVARPVKELSPGKRAVAREILANGATTVVRVSHHEGVPDDPGPLRDGEHLRTNGTYYQVNATVVERTEATGYQMDLQGPIRERRADRYAAAETQAVPFDSLSSPEQRLVLYAMPSERERASATVHAGYYYQPAAEGSLDDSPLLDGEPHYVEYEGQYFRIQFEGDRPKTVRLRVRYGLVPVADSAAAFVDDRLGEFVTQVNETTLTGAARPVVLRTLREGYIDWEGTVETRPDGFTAAQAWVHDHRYVRYDGTLYRLDVQEVIE